MLKILNPKYFLDIMTKISITLKSKKKYLSHSIIRTNQKKLFKGEKTPEVNRLIGSLRINSSCTRKILERNSPFSLDKKLEKKVLWYLYNR